MEQNRSDALEHRGHANELLTVAISTGGTALCEYHLPDPTMCAHRILQTPPRG